ncbi:hypothetical protein D3C85_1689340 [compost metagenome]
MATFLDTLPDVLERSAGLSAAQVTKLQSKMAAVRADLYEDALSVVLHGKPSQRWSNASSPDTGAAAPAEAKQGQRKRRSKPAD